MTQPLPSIYLVRHGETAWTRSRQHTGLTDLPLTEIGERDASRLGVRPPVDRFPHFHQPVAACSADLRVGRFRRQGHRRSGSGGMELWQLRRPDQRTDSQAAAGLATVPRRLPGGRIGR